MGCFPLFSITPHAKILSEEDFLQAFDTHADDVFRHCYLRVGERESSKKIIAEAFRHLWLFIAQGNYVDSIKLYLYREINALIERQPVVSRMPAELPIALRRWSPDRRAVFILQYVDRLTSKQICAVLGGSIHENALTNQELTSIPSIPAYA